MKKHTKLMALLMAAALVFGMTACGETGPKETEAAQVETTEESVIAESLPEETEQASEKAADVTPDITGETLSNGSQESFVITVTDQSTGDVLWTYESGSYDMMQLSNFSILNVMPRNNSFYFEEADDLICFDAVTGEIKWKLEGQIFRAPHSAFDAEGNLYVVYWMANHLHKITPDGVIDKDIDLDQETGNKYYWPYEITIENRTLSITFDGGPNGDGAQAVMTADIDSWELSMPE